MVRRRDPPKGGQEKVWESYLQLAKQSDPYLEPKQASLLMKKY
jgi:hypothetical protein